MTRKEAAAEIQAILGPDVWDWGLTVRPRSHSTKRYGVGRRSVRIKGSGWRYEVYGTSWEDALEKLRQRYATK